VQIPRYPVTVKGKISSLTVTARPVETGGQAGRPMEKLPSSQETLVYGGFRMDPLFSFQASWTEPGGVSYVFLFTEEVPC
jgi:hypothetical protein